MTTLKNSTALSASIAEMTKLGVTAGASSMALFKAVKYFSNLVAKTHGLAATDETCAEYANAFADGQEKGSGDKISDGSRKQYRDQMKLWADSKVNAILPEIEKETTAFVARTSLAERGDRRFFMIAKAAASRIRKGKAEKITPELFADICKAKAKTPPKPEDAAKDAKTAFVAACKDMIDSGVVDTDEKRDSLIAFAGLVGIEIKFESATPKPVVPQTPADLNAVIAAAVAAAIAGMKS